MKAGKGKEVYILDTSALLTYIEDEKGANLVEELLVKAERGEVQIYIAFISVTEVYYVTLQERGEDEALRRIRLLQSLSVAIEESNEDLNLRAGGLKAANRISLADAFIAALCQRHGGALVHKDPEFEKLSAPLKEYRLPYKNSADVL